MQLPVQAKPAWDGIIVQVREAHLSWSSFKVLFGKQGRIDLLNEAAPGIFNVIQFSLISKLVLTLSSLNDKTRGTLTLCTLIKELEGCSVSRSFLNELKVCRLRFVDKCKQVKVTRDNYLAHNNLAQAIPHQVIDWPSRGEMESALCTLREFVSLISNHFGLPEIAFERYVMRGDAEELVELLKRALRYRQLLGEGRILFDDFRESPWYGV